MLVPAITGQSYARNTKLGTVGTGMILCGCIMMLAVGWLLQRVVLHVGLSGRLSGCSPSGLCHRGRPYTILTGSLPRPSDVAGSTLHAFIVVLNTSLYRLRWSPRDRRSSSNSSNVRALGTPSSLICLRHMAGPTKLRCHDDGFHACDVAVGEDLGVWDLVFPRDSTDLSEAVRFKIRWCHDKNELHTIETKVGQVCFFQ